jgi:hypothetical protein
MGLVTDGHYMLRIIRRILLYLTLAFGALAVCAVLVVLTAHAHVRHSGAWIFLVGYTGLLIYFTVTPFRALWRGSGFWVAVMSLVGAHLAACVSLLHYDPGWRPIWFAPIVIIEIFLFVLILGALFRRPTHSRRRRA